MTVRDTSIKPCDGEVEARPRRSASTRCLRGGGGGGARPGPRSPPHAHGHAETLRPAPAPQPLHGRHVVVVAAVADLDVGLADSHAIGGIEADPAAAREIGFYPGVRGIRAQIETRARLEISAHVARGNAEHPAHREHRVRVVLAYP